MGASIGGGRRRRGFTDINITPFVDVMLVLLIVFMVTAPLLTTGLRINLPEVNAAVTPVKDSKLLVTITKDEQVLFGDKDVTADIGGAFRNSDRVQLEQELYIRADKDARYEIVATVIAAARSNGVDSLNLLVEPEIQEAVEEANARSKAQEAADSPKPPRPGGRSDAVLEK